MDNFNGKTCVIYTRVSSQSQINKGHGLESQEIICRERAKNNGIQVLEVFVDGGVSGKFESREGLDRMIEFLKKENKKETIVDFVIADDMDRISRDIVGRHNIKYKIEHKGKAKIQTVKQYLEDTPEGQLMQNIVVSMKQYERENNAKRTVSRKRARLLEGYWVHNTPSGYTYEGKGANKKVVITEKGIIIKEALELYAQGYFRNDTEFKYYMSDKIPSMSERTAENILGGERLLFYAGFINDPSQGINMVEAKHEPLISIDILEKIIERKKRKIYYRKETREDIANKMPLRNYLICEDCGKIFSGGPSTGKIGKIYYYYRCVNPCCATRKSLNVDIVHQKFEEFLQTLIVEEPIVKCFEFALVEEFNNTNQFVENERKELENRLKNIERQSSELLELILNEEIQETKEIYKKSGIVGVKKKVLLE